MSCCSTGGTDRIVHGGRHSGGGGMGGVFSPPGWPAVLSDAESGVVLRPYHRRDASVWATVRRRNEEWLAPWEPTAPPGSWSDLNSPASFRIVLRELRRLSRAGTSMPF